LIQSDRNWEEEIERTRQRFDSMYSPRNAR
jgi:hypothetical protein